MSARDLGARWDPWPSVPTATEHSIDVPIRLDRATVHRSRLDLIQSVTASSHKIQTLTHLLVKLEASGLEGWGEAPTLSEPYYVAETTDSAWMVIRDLLLPSVMRTSFTSVDEATRTFQRVQGNQFAVSAVEGAAWDLWAKLHGRPLAETLGGTCREVGVAVVFGLQATDELIPRIQQAINEGYRTVKLKIQPGRDRAVLEAVRSEFPELTLRVDANGAYNRNDYDTLCDLDKYRLEYIEQPLPPDDLLGHAELQTRSSTPICLDESISSVERARHALALASCQVMSIKPARVGGLGAAVEIHDLCEAAGVPVLCGGMHDFGVGRATNIALATLPGFQLHSEVAGSRRYFRRDIVRPRIESEGGKVHPRYAPGIGYDVDEEFIVAISDHVHTLAAN